MRKKFNFVHSIGETRPYCETVDWSTDYLRIVLRGIDASDDYLFDNFHNLNGVYQGGVRTHTQFNFYSFRGTFCHRKRRVDRDLYLEFVNHEVSPFQHFKDWTTTYNNLIYGMSYEIEGISRENAKTLEDKYKVTGECEFFGMNGRSGSKPGLILSKETTCKNGVTPTPVNPSMLGMISNPLDRSLICTFNLVKK